MSSLQKKSVLVLWGRQDKILEPSVVERLGKELPQARITYVENCGTTHIHMTYRSGRQRGPLYLAWC